MSNLKDQLIKLGSENPDLRGHIFKIIDYMKLANSKENLVRKLVKDSREAAEFIDLFGMRIPNRGSRKENKFNQIIEKYFGEEYFLKGSLKKQVAKLSFPSYLVDNTIQKIFHLQSHKIQLNPSLKRIQKGPIYVQALS